MKISNNDDTCLPLQTPRQLSIFEQFPDAESMISYQKKTMIGRIGGAITTLAGVSLIISGVYVAMQDNARIGCFASGTAFSLLGGFAFLWSCKRFSVTVSPVLINFSGFDSMFD